MRVGFADLYDLVMRAAERGRLAAWRREIIGAAGGDVLEIAAGTGLNFSHYRAGTAVVATEPDIAMLDRARSRARLARASIVLVAADAQQLPFRDRSVDTVTIALGLCTIPSPTKALGEVHRVLRSGGLARLLEHVRLERPVAGRLQDLVTPAWRRIAGGCRLNERTVRTVERAGFSIDGIQLHAGGLFVGIKASPLERAS
ncbi:MAG TPA: methyltransferase domain-containing protein [Gemmatimonadaceae bacterium]|nr:methyltransferase domain-containing protein [Gemmatimonadaceae bacterium]